MAIDAFSPPWCLGVYLFVSTLPAFSQAAEDNRPPVVLTERARKLHDSALVIDGHNDMPWEIRKQADSK